MTLQDLQVRTDLRRQFAGVRLSILLDSSFLLFERPARVVELRFEEAVGADGKLFAILEVLLDEERRQPLRDLHHLVRVAAAS